MGLGPAPARNSLILNDLQRLFFYWQKKNPAPANENGDEVRLPARWKLKGHLKKVNNADKGDYAWQNEHASKNHILKKRSILFFHGKKPPFRGAL